MTVLGIQNSKTKSGTKVTTLHVSEDFESYYTDKDKGRECAGKRVESIYVGEYDCTDIKIGSEIEVFYGKAVSTPRGTFSPIRKIEVVAKKA